jgi:hypothetical protein
MAKQKPFFLGPGNGPQRPSGAAPATPTSRPAGCRVAQQKAPGNQSAPPKLAAKK